MEEESRNIKRSRDESSDEFTELKRFRETDLIFEILDDDDVVASGVDYLADVMKSLEEEITAPEAAGPSPDQLDLGYLLEASDDELGLPPASASDGGSVVEIVAEAETDRIWGYDEYDVTASPYESLQFGAMTEFDDAVNFDGDLFDYSEGVFGPLDGDREFSIF